MKLMKPEWPRVLLGMVACAFFAIIGLTTYVSEVSSSEKSPAVQRKTVSLIHSSTAAEHFFIGNCGKCHKLPDPANPARPKPDCTSGIPEIGAAMAQDYMADVRAGKNLYESYCGRCHNLIDPVSHTYEYWSKNICASDNGMEKKKLKGEEEQKVLLYLSSRAGKN